jgi:hypothetical protein
MKTRIAIILLSAIVLLSFTVVRNNKSARKMSDTATVNYSSSAGQPMTDKDQFN